MNKNKGTASFYDAFGNKLGQAEEVWCGDSFEREATNCSYTIGGVSNMATLTANNCIVNKDVLMNTLAGGSYSHAEGATSIAKGCTGITTTVTIDELTDKLAILQAQIDALKRRQTVTSELRSALKTLHYKREVE